MALVDNAWYVNYGDGSTTGYYALAQWTALTAYTAGQIVRQLAAPAVGSERVFVCVVAGTSLASEPSWTLTRGATTAEAAGPTWQECTGIAALNGDATNTPSWTITATPPGGVKNTAVTKGQVIKRDSGASYQICTTAGTAGNGAEPAFSNTAGTTTADNTVTWTSLGVVGNFTAGNSLHARVANCLTATWAQAGNKVFVGDNHAETQSTTITIAGAGTNANPIFIYCADKTISNPGSGDLKTTGTISNTGVGTNITISGNTYYYGLTFDSGSGGATSNAIIPGSSGNWSKFDSCALRKTGTTANVSALQLQGGDLELVNTTVQFGATGDFFKVVSGNLFWRNTPSAITGATLPTTLISKTGTCNVYIQGVDLSALGSGKTLVAASTQPAQVTLVDCKLGTSVTIAATPAQVMERTDLVRCDSGATNYRAERYWYQGTQTTETTIIRTGGASDGTTPIAWKLVSTANSKWVMPFESQPIMIWNDSTSAITTLTLYGTTTGGGVPNNDDIWVEVEYLGSALTPQGSFITTTKANNLAASAATNNSSDASTWAGGGAGNGFKIVVPSFTPGMKGPLNITIKVAKASTTYYIDPLPSISGVTVSKSAILAPGVFANELSSGAAASGGFIIGGQ